MKKRTIIQIRSILFLVLAMTAWGTSFVSNKIVIEHIPPISSAAIRFLIASSIMFIIISISGKKNSGKPMTIPKEHFSTLLLSAITGISIYFIFENYGLYYTTASAAALITSAIPTMTLLFEIAFLKRKILPRQILGAVISLIGVYLITKADTVNARNAILGNLLMLGCCISWVLFNHFSIKIQKSASTLTVTAWQSLYGAIFLLPFFYIERGAWKPIPVEVWFHLLYLALICSVACYFIYNYALRGVGSVTAGAFINLIPVIGALSGVTFLNETLVFQQIIGGITVLGCIWLIMDRQKQ